MVVVVMVECNNPFNNSHITHNNSNNNNSSNNNNNNKHNSLEKKAETIDSAIVVGALRQ
jgi:hypothetical protein